MSDSTVGSFGAKIGMIKLSDRSKTGEELHDDCSESTNVKSVIRLDIGCIAAKVHIQAELEKYITIGHIPLPKQLMTWTNKLFLKLP